ncbi:MAG: hypothetical protein KKB25_03800 [Nanoarchaeota archaeon]|nr:hypothetical protein [Nanoarchaeota archaeon]
MRLIVFLMFFPNFWTSQKLKCAKAKLFQIFAHNGDFRGAVPKEFVIANV